MNTAVLMLATLTAVQGQAFQLTYPDEPGLQSIDVLWNERRVPFVRSSDDWITVIGIDLDTGPGQYSADVRFIYDGGSSRTRTEVIDVEDKSFPTTELSVAPGYVQLSAENRQRAARESREIGAIYSQLTPEAYWSERFQVPVPGTTGGRNFGHRRIFNGEPRSPHSGADLTASTGTKIHATNAGRVVLAKDLFFSGNAVFIDHGLGVFSTYLHLSETLVEAGDMVERGQAIGLAGATGRVTGPHLHWGVRVLDARVDPFSLLSLGSDEVF